MNIVTTFRKAVLSLALFVVPPLAAEPPSTTQQRPDGEKTRLETPSADPIPVDAYNNALTQDGTYNCEARSCDAAPALLAARAPAYPGGALRAGMQGQAAVIFDIDSAGVPQNISVESATAAVFGAAAVVAIKHWRFRPAMLGGKPVKFERVLQRFPFELQD